MTERRGKKFEPMGAAAIEPRAFGLFFDAHEAEPVRLVDGVAVVSVVGPLVHHRDWCFDSYDAIKGRVGEALELGARAVVLSLDSPGGLVSGAFDTAEEIRALCDARGVDLYAYVDGSACSAAYALASVAKRIVVPPTGIVGSIGTVAKIVSVAAINAAQGVDVRIVASGARKADGDPDVPIDDASVAAVREQIDTLAALFFEHVSKWRGASPDELRAMQAGVVVGSSSVPVLADHVLGLDQLTAAIASNALGPDPKEGKPAMDQQTTTTPKAGYMEDAREALKKAAEAGDENAKRALAALNGDGEPDGDEKKADAPASPPSDDEKKDKPAAEAPSDDPKAIAARLAVLESKAAAAEAGERAALLASRSDLDEPTRALLAKAPIADVRAYVASAPRKGTPKPAATAVVGGTPVEGAERGAPTTPDRAALAAAFGLTEARVRPTTEAAKTTFPAMTRAERRDWLDERARKTSAR